MHDRGIFATISTVTPAVVIPITAVLPHILFLLPQISRGITVVPVTAQVSSVIVTILLMFMLNNEHTTNENITENSTDWSVRVYQNSPFCL